MKKLLIAVALLVASSFVFANESIVLENFWNKGQVIKIIENDKITYVNKSSILNIETGKGDEWWIKISNSVYSKSYHSKDYDLTSDNAGNIVITKKIITFNISDYL